MLLDSGSGRPQAPPSDRVDYGSDVVARACRFVRARAGLEPPHGRRWYLDADGARALLDVVRNEPVLAVTLTTSAQGRRIRAQLAGRTLGVPRNRICAAVWSVPAEVPVRPSGNRHRALRAALNATARAGVTIAPVVGLPARLEWAARAAEVSPRLRSWAADAPHRLEERWWVAQDPAGRIAGLAAVVVDEQWASLITLIGFDEHDGGSAARFALHHAVTRELATTGVRHLAVLDDSPLLAGAGARHIQRVLGYRLTRLRRPALTARAFTDPGTRAANSSSRPTSQPDVAPTLHASSREQRH